MRANHQGTLGAFNRHGLLHRHLHYSYSAAGSIPRKAGAAASILAPQLPQNAKPSGFSEPHDGQMAAMARGLDPGRLHRVRPVLVGPPPSGLRPPAWWGDDPFPVVGSDWNQPGRSLVAQLNQDSAAEKAGIKVGDIIVRYDGTEVRDTTQLRNMIAATAPGATWARLLIWMAIGIVLYFVYGARRSKVS